MNTPERPYVHDQELYWNERARVRARHVTGAVGWLRPLEVAAVATAVAGREVLDAGCGDGEIAQWCRRLRRHVHIRGVDLSAEMVSLARKRGVEAVEGNLLDLPWPDDTFDTAYAVRSIKNVLDENDQKLALGQLARVATRRVVVVDSIRDEWTGQVPEFNLYPSHTTIVDTLADAGFRLRRSVALRDWYWMVRRRDRFGNERAYVFVRDSIE
jgi:SAM-dependent methyltransferase